MSTRPQPVINAATFKTVIQSAVYVLGVLGANSAQHWVDTHTAVLIAVGVVVVNAGGDLLAAIHAAGKVTPLEAPQTHDGTPLGPVALASAPVAVVPVDEPLTVEPMDG